MAAPAAIVVPAASASDAGMVAAVKAAAPAIKTDEAAFQKGVTDAVKTHDATGAKAALAKLTGDYSSLRSAIKAQSPSTTHGTKAKSLIVKGLNDTINAFHKFSRALTDAAHGDKAAYERDFAKAQKPEQKATTELDAGFKLLGV